MADHTETTVLGPECVFKGELRAAGMASLYCWQGRTSEVEFIVETPAGPVPIEVKSGRVTRSKSLKVFEERYHPDRSYVLSGCNSASHANRRFVPLYAAGRLPGMLLDPRTAHRP